MNQDKNKIGGINSYLLASFIIVFIIGFGYLVIAGNYKVLIAKQIPPENNQASTSPFPNPTVPLFTYMMGGRQGTSVISSVPSNDVWASVDGATWTLRSPDQATGTTKWSQRAFGASAYFLGKIWMLGGQGVGGILLHDIWTSRDGIAWTHLDTNTVTPGIQDAPWSGRTKFNAVVWNGKLWVIGGTTGTSGTSVSNEVWSTVDGINWNLSYAQWPARSNGAVVVFNNKLWVIDGTCINGASCNDVWSTIDGITWTHVADASIPTGGGPAVGIVYGNLLYVTALGVGSADKIYSSSDGNAWMLINPSASWGPRSFFSLFNRDNFVWMLAGSQISTQVPMHDVYKSGNGGVSWTAVTTTAPWTGRWGQSVVVAP